MVARELWLVITQLVLTWCSQTLHTEAALTAKYPANFEIGRPSRACLPSALLTKLLTLHQDVSRVQSFFRGAAPRVRRMQRVGALQAA